MMHSQNRSTRAIARVLVGTKMSSLAGVHSLMSDSDQKSRLDEEVEFPCRGKSQTKPNVSFSGCGFLIPYHFGAALALKEKSFLLDDIEKIGGCSGGVLVATMCFIEIEKWHLFFDVIADYLAELRSKCFPQINVDFSEVYRRVAKIIDEEVIERLRGKLHISLTNVPLMKNFVATEFNSKDSLMELMKISSFIPYYSGLSPPKYKRKHFIDGGFSKLAVDFGPNTVIITPFHGSGYGICPNSETTQFPSRSLSGMQLDVDPANFITVANMLIIPTFDKSKKFFIMGFNDATNFIEKSLHPSLLRKTPESSVRKCYDDFMAKFDKFIECSSTSIIELSTIVDNLKKGFSLLF